MKDENRHESRKQKGPLFIYSIFQTTQSHAFCSGEDLVQGLLQVGGDTLGLALEHAHLARVPPIHDQQGLYMQCERKNSIHIIHTCHTYMDVHSQASSGEADPTLLTLTTATLPP